MATSGGSIDVMGWCGTSLSLSTFPLEIIRSLSDCQSEIMDVHSTFALEEPIFLAFFFGMDMIKMLWHVDATPNLLFGIYKCGG